MQGGLLYYILRIYYYNLLIYYFTLLYSTILYYTLLYSTVLHSTTLLYSGELAKGKVDVPFPMHIGIDETATAGPGDCHIKGGYVSGAPTWTVQLA